MNESHKCSIAWCPWKAKYSFGTIGYYECWFHGGMIPWLEIIWDFLFYYPRMMWNSIRYGRMKWKINPYFVIKELIEYQYGK